MTVPSNENGTERRFSVCGQLLSLLKQPFGCGSGLHPTGQPGLYDLIRALDIPQDLGYHTFREQIGVSFNGRTADSGSANWGSNPCTPAKELAWYPQMAPFFIALLT